MRARKLIKHQTWEKRGGKGEGYAVAKFSPPPPLSSLYFKPVTNPSLPGYGKKNPSASIVRKRKGERIKKLHVHGPNPLPSFLIPTSVFPCRNEQNRSLFMYFRWPASCFDEIFFKPRERLSDLISPAALGRALRKGWGWGGRRGGHSTGKRLRPAATAAFSLRKKAGHA